MTYKKSLPLLLSLPFLLAVQQAAWADDVYSVPSPNGAGTVLSFGIDAGVILDHGDVNGGGALITSWDGSDFVTNAQTPMLNGGATIYNLSNISILDADTVSARGTAAILTATSDGIFNLNGDVTITGASSNATPLSAFIYTHLNAVAPFSGTINASGSIITVDHQGTGSSVAPADAYGIFLTQNGGGVLSGAEFSGKADIGEIRVTAEDNATGWFSGAFTGGQLKTGDVTVTSNGNSSFPAGATGFAFEGDISDAGDAGSFFETGTITVGSHDRNAIGIDAREGGGITLNNAANNIGEINATVLSKTAPTGTHAVGIRTEGTSTFTVKNDITAENMATDTSDNAYGILLGGNNHDITVNNDVAIQAAAAGGNAASIRMDGTGGQVTIAEKNVGGTFTNGGAAFVLQGVESVNFNSNTNLTGGSFDSQNYTVANNKEVRLGNSDITTTGNDVNIAVNGDAGLFQTTGQMDVDGIVTKTGTGTLDLSVSTGGPHTAGAYDIQAGTLKSGINQNGQDTESTVFADNTKSSGDGTFTFGNNAKWNVVVGNGVVPGSTFVVGNGSNNGLFDTASAQAALDRGDRLVKFAVAADGTITLTGVLPTANVSDIFASTAYLHKRNTIFGGVNSHIDAYFTYNPVFEFGGINRSSDTMLGQSADAVVPLEVQGIGMRSLWANYVNRNGGVQSSYGNYSGSTIKSSSDGVQAGFDFATGRGYVFGMIFGYEDIDSRVRQDYARGDDYYFGLYAAKQFFNGFDVRGSVGYGHQKYDISRFDGNDRFRFDTKGDTLEANLELGRRFYRGVNFSFRPFVGFDFLNNNVNGANEGAAGFRYGKAEFQQGFVRVGSDVQWMYGRFNANGLFAFSQQLLDDSASASISQGALTSTLRANKYGNSVFTFGIGGSYALNQTQSWTLFVNYNADVFADGYGEASHTVSAGTQWKF